MKKILTIVFLFGFFGGFSQTFESVVQFDGMYINKYADELAVSNTGEYAFASSNLSWTEIIIKVYNTNGIVWQGSIAASAFAYSGSLHFDNNGNLYIACNLAGDITLPDGNTFSTPSSTVSFALIKFDPDGDLIWEDHFGAINDDFQIYSMDISGDDIAICGRFDGTLKGQVSDHTDACRYTYDTSGVFQWFRHVGGSTVDQAISVTIQGSNIISTGFFEGSNVDFGNGYYYSTTEYDYFMLSLNLLNGQTNWAAHLEVSSGAPERYLYTISDGTDIYISGKQSDNFFLRNEDGTTDTILNCHQVWNGAGIHIFLAKYNSSGNVEWGRTIPSRAECETYGIELDDVGNILIAGIMEDSLLLKVTPQSDSLYLVSTQSTHDDLFFMKLKPDDGEPIWGHNVLGNSTYDLGVDIEGCNDTVYMMFLFNTTSIDINHGPGMTNITTGNGPYAISKYIDNYNPWYNSATSNNWNDSLNWSVGQPPLSTDDVVIGSGASNFPTVTSAGFCNNITIEVGASLLGQENLTVNGEATVEYSVTGYTGSTDGWNFISAPVNNMAIIGSNFQPGSNDDLYAWDEAEDLWRNYKDPSNPSTWFDYFDSVTGYLLSKHPDNDGTLQFKGDFNTSTVTVNLSNTNTAWNLVGNPFPSPVDWSQVSLTNADSPKTLNNTTGAYEDLGTELNTSEGIFLFANGDNASMSIETAVQTHGISGKKSNEMNQAKFVAHFGSHSVYTSILIEEWASKKFDPPYDARYLPPFTEIPWLCHYIEDDQVFVSRFAFSPNDELTEIPVCFRIPDNAKNILWIHDAPVNSETALKNISSTKEMDITFSFEGDFPYADIILKDKQTGIETNLSQGNTYTWKASSEDDPWRFVLLLAPVGIEEEAIEETIYIYPNPVNDKLYLSYQGSDRFVVDILTINGDQIRQYEIINNKVVDVSDLSNGVYILKVNKVQTIKIIKR